MNEAPRRPGTNLKKLLLELLNRWHWIALGLVLGILGGVYVLSKTPKLYTAQSTLLVKQQGGTIVGGDVADQGASFNMGSAEAMMTVSARLERRELLRRVGAREDVRELPGLIPKPVEYLPDWAADLMGRPAIDPDADAEGIPSPEALAGRISNWMTVSIRKGTRLIDVGIEHQDPGVAKALADALAVEYVAELSGSRTQGRTSTLDVLEEEVESARGRLQTSESALSSYRRALDIQKVLEGKQGEVRELARRYKPKHPRMAAALDELAVLQEDFLEEFEIARSSAVEANYWNQSAEAWEGLREAPAEERVATAQRLLASRVSVLESEIVSRTSVFNSLLTKAQETDINRQASEAEVEVDSLAVRPSLPTKPVPARLVSIWGIGGLAAGLGIAFFFRWLDNKLHHVAQIEAETGYPALSAVGFIPDKALRQAEKKRAKHESKEPEGRAAWEPHLVFRRGLDDTNFAEMFRTLRASITLLGDEKRRKITLFTSAVPGEGKTLISANFALASAGQGRKTLLLDLDLRKPALHREFGLPRATEESPGMTELLAGQVQFDEVARPVPGADHLDAIFGGARAPNPGELLNPKRIEELFDLARNRYDAIVVDTAPLLAVPDSRVLAPLANNLCLVVRAEYVPKGAVRRAIDILEAAETPPCGLVFNGFIERKRYIGYNYTYGQYKSDRYGNPYKYGYGGYGSYGSYGSREE